MKYILLFTTFLFAGELEVDGDLTVLGNLNAPGLGGMKPERIYSLPVTYTNEGSNLIVPNGKVWRLTGSSGGITIDILGTPNISADINNNSDVWLLQNKEFTITHAGESLMTIFEYPISASGTDQGMDYVEP